MLIRHEVIFQGAIVDRVEQVVTYDVVTPVFDVSQSSELSFEVEVGGAWSFTLPGIISSDPEVAITDYSL